MLTATTPLRDLLLSKPQTLVSIPLLTLTLRDGTVLRWARYTSDVTFGGTTWSAHAKGTRPQLATYRWRRTVGLDEIGTFGGRFACGETATLNGQNMRVAAAQGVFDEAKLLLERAYAASPADPIVGKLFRFYGIVASADGDSEGFALQAVSPAGKLKSIRWPKTLLSASCQNTFCDVACGLALAAQTTSGLTVQAGSTNRVVNVSGGPWADDHWALGWLALGSPVTSRRGIRGNVGNALELTIPLPAAPADGTTIALTLGCDNTLGDQGCLRFSNLTRYRATPLLPQEG